MIRILRYSKLGHIVFEGPPGRRLHCLHHARISRAHVLQDPEPKLEFQLDNNDWLVFSGPGVESLWRWYQGKNPRKAKGQCERCGQSI